MPMIPCSSCDRFIVQSQRNCPFCGTTIRLSSSPVGGFAGVLLGLSLAACTPDPGSEDGDSAASSDSTAADGTTVGASATTVGDPSTSSSSSSSSGPGTTMVSDTLDAETSAYGGPPPESSTGFDDTDTDSTGSETGSGSGSTTG